MGYASNAEMLLAAGRDAVSNLYDIYIIPPTGLGIDNVINVSTAMVVRSKNFTPPTLSVDLAKVHYKTDFIDVPLPKITGEKEFEIPYRIDAMYAIHNAMRKWKFAATMNTSSTNIDGDDSEEVSVPAYTYNGIWGANHKKVFGKVAVIAQKYSGLFEAAAEAAGGAQGLLGSLGVAGGDFIGYVYDNAWVYDLNEPEFTRDDSSIQEATAKFKFISYGLIGANAGVIGTMGTTG